jgi:hypothetical protein
MPYNYVSNVPQRARIHAADGSPVVDDANPSMEDARLIASAPDLLETAQNLLAEYDRKFGKLIAGTTAFADAYLALHNAIAKATGSEVGK